MVESNPAAASENPTPADTVKVEANGVEGEETKEDTPVIQEAVTGVTPLQKQETGAAP